MASLRSFLRRVLARSGLNQPSPYTQLPGIWPGFRVPADLRLSIMEQLQVSAVWGAIRLITDSIAGGTWKVFAREGGRRIHQPDSGVAYLWNTRPNPEMPARSFVEAMLGQMLIWGDAYAEIVFDQVYQVAELWPLESERMRGPMRDKGKDPLFYRYNQISGPVVDMPANRVLHFRGPSFNGWLGSSTLGHAAKSIALAAAEQSFASSYFLNGTVLSGYVKVPGRLQGDAADHIRQEWENLRPRKKFKPAVLQNGAEWVPLEVDAQKALLVEAQQFAVSEIARYFGVPPAFLGSELHSGARAQNIGEMYLMLVRSLGPWAQRLVQEAQYKLFSGRATVSVELDLTHLTRGNAKEQAETNEILIRSGQRTINECRNADNLNDLPGPEEAEPAAPQVEAILAGHVRRVRARRVDLRRAGKPEAEVRRHEAALAEEALGELRALPGLAAPDGALRAAVDSVIAGIEPAKAARHLLGGTV